MRVLEPSWEDWQAVCERFGADEELLREYELYPDLARITGGALYVRGRQAALFVKRTASSCGRLAQIHQLVERVAKGGSRVSRFVMTKYGDAFVARRDGLFYATAALPGAAPRLERTQDYLAAVALLATWHRDALTDPGELVAMDRLDLPGRLMQDLARLEACREEALRRSEPSVVDQLFLSVRDDLVRAVQAVLVALREVDYPALCRIAWAAGTVCHGSFVRQNLLSHDSLLSVLDHDHVYLGPQVLDLAAFLRRYTRLYDWAPDTLVQGVALYERIRTLSAGEYAVLPALLMYPENVLRVLEWYYERRHDAPEEEFLDALEREWDWHEACRTTLIRLYGIQDVSQRQQEASPPHVTDAAQAVLSNAPLVPEEAEADEGIPGLTRFWRSWRRLSAD